MSDVTHTYMDVFQYERCDEMVSMLEVSDVESDVIDGLLLKGRGWRCGKQNQRKGAWRLESTAQNEWTAIQVDHSMVKQESTHETSIG